MKAKTKEQRKDRVLKRPTPAPAPRRGTSRRGLLITVVAVVLAFAATWAFFELVVWNTVPPELVGKWVVVDGPQEGATFDFYRGGSLRGVVNIDGREAILDASIRVEAKKIYSTTTNPRSGRADTKVQLIRVLTADELVVEDTQGQRLNMRRAAL